MRAQKHFVAAVALLLPLLACGFSGESSSSAARLDDWGIELEVDSFSGGPQPDGSYRFTSADGSSTLTVSAATPGAPAAERAPTEIASGGVQWSRPRQYDGMSGMEARLTDHRAGRVHWVGAVDAPGGVVWLHLETSTEWIDTPTRGDPGWETIARRVRRAR